MRQSIKNFLLTTCVIAIFILPIKLFAAQDDLFKSLGKLKKINGNQTIKKVHSDILKAIKKYENIK